MTDPWVEVEEVKEPGFPTRQGEAASAWQALVAGLVEIPPYEDWVKLKWGLNAALLHEEALERQRIFFESQYTYPDELGEETIDYRTLALRLISQPGEGLMVALVGKIHGPTEADARNRALSYLAELKATLPYDYRLVPACSRDEYLEMSGSEILDPGQGPPQFAQIKRTEFPLSLKVNLPILHGLWRSGPHAHEPIWRSLAASKSPVLLNLYLRSTVLYEAERERLTQNVAQFPDSEDFELNPTTYAGLKEWNKTTNERRLAPWKKFFYLQVHLASPQKISEDLLRTIGNSLVQNQKDSPPGFQVIVPRQHEYQTWRKNIRNLDPIFSGSILSFPRLAEVADVEEMFEVMRLPYCPPDQGFPDMKFVTARSA